MNKAEPPDAHSRLAMVLISAFHCTRCTFYTRSSSVCVGGAQDQGTCAMIMEHDRPARPPPRQWGSQALAGFHSSSLSCRSGAARTQCIVPFWMARVLCRKTGKTTRAIARKRVLYTSVVGPAYDGGMNSTSCGDAHARKRFSVTSMAEQNNYHDRMQGAATTGNENDCSSSFMRRQDSAQPRATSRRSSMSGAAQAFPLLEPIPLDDSMREALQGALERLCAEQPLMQMRIWERLNEYGSVGAEWRHVIECLVEYEFRGTLIARILEREPQLLRASVRKHILPVLEFFRLVLSLQRPGMAQILRHCPALLLEPVDKMKVVLAVLKTLDFRDEDLQFLLKDFPSLFCAKPEDMCTLIELLCGEEFSMSRRELRPIVRRAPWILTLDPHTQVIPGLTFLRALELPSVRDAVRIGPQLLLPESVDVMTRVYEYLMKLGISQAGIRRLAPLYPTIFLADPDQELEPVIQVLRGIGLSQEELCRGIVSFPNMLMLSVETQIIPVVEFLRSRNVQNVARVVAKNPAVLTYDVTTVLAPKVDYLENRLGLSSFDLLIFPAYFSYSLSDRIVPRTLFLKRLGISIADAGLSNAISLTDEDFCRWTARVPREEYDSFLNSAGLMSMEDSRLSRRAARQRRRRRRQRLLRHANSSLKEHAAANKTGRS
ncbi:Transcription termination factor MTEF1, chloroplastic [Porphyridium purpureum]|uniref:Transcription termination factor MTEF1, chloroplastic n=1 Tax=Porphyridium purpureum TaxID=35688 RepID=A0A5J4Z0R3_PORPP|nr:Transcription termination factor MTEF1, chloroplastic [Porphyridium purpureum]|eukprot:POR9123..scf208_2